MQNSDITFETDLSHANQSYCSEKVYGLYRPPGEIDFHIDFFCNGLARLLSFLFLFWNRFWLLLRFINWFDLDFYFDFDFYFEFDFYFDFDLNFDFYFSFNLDFELDFEFDFPFAFEINFCINIILFFYFVLDINFIRININF